MNSKKRNLYFKIRFARKLELMQTDLQELEESIYPNYQEVVKLNNKAQTLHREKDTIIQHIQSDVDDMDSKFVATMNKLTIQ